MLQLGRVKLLGHLCQLAFLLVGQPFLVCGTVFRQVSADIEQVGAHLVAQVAEHTGYGQRIAAIVSGSCKRNDGYRSVPSGADGACQCRSSSLHQVDGLDGLVLYCVFVKLMYLSTCQYFHCDAKLVHFRQTTK